MVVGNSVEFAFVDRLLAYVHTFVLSSHPHSYISALLQQADFAATACINTTELLYPQLERTQEYRFCMYKKLI